MVDGDGSILAQLERLRRSMVGMANTQLAGRLGLGGPATAEGAYPAVEGARTAPDAGARTPSSAHGALVATTPGHQPTAGERLALASSAGGSWPLV